MPEMRGYLWKCVLRRGNRTCKDPEAGAQQGGLSGAREREQDRGDAGLTGPLLWLLWLLLQVTGRVWNGW